MTDDIVARLRAVDVSWSQVGEDCAAAADEIERLRAALEKIATQKKTDELDTEYDVEFADFEGGYDILIDIARAALNETKGE